MPQSFYRTFFPESYVPPYNIYSAVRLLENAFELGPEMRVGYVITEQNWQGIVERNYL